MKYKIGSCPFDKPYASPIRNPNEDSDEEIRVFLECSGQGDCDRTTGSCVCFDGYEGVACQRMSCPNLCSGHGICDPVNLLGLDQSLIDNNYIHETVNNDYKLWDKSNSYACVCDAEWTGYDCSLRKCPTGYVASSDCDAPSQSTQTIKFTIKNETKTHAYLYYTDYYYREYSTDLIDLTDEESWRRALYTLPAGSIDIASVDLTSSPTTQGSKAGNYTVSIKFGKHQTGRQPQIKVIGTKELDEKPYSTGSDTKSGYKGMSKEVKKDQALYEGIVGYENTGIPPISCSGNGLCNPTTGLCDCFLGYYGLACTEQAALI